LRLASARFGPVGADCVGICVELMVWPLKTGGYLRIVPEATSTLAVIPDIHKVIRMNQVTIHSLAQTTCGPGGD
jgi:hypothetical protein